MTSDVVSAYFRWYYYSTYHPSWNLNKIIADYHAGKSLADVIKEYENG